MSEEQQYQGDRWTKQTKNILSKLGWSQIGDSNFDISCKNKTAHKTGKKNRINPHGVDLAFSFYDPYSKKEIGLIVESKHRKWSGIDNNSISDFLKQLQMTVECASTDSTLANLNCPTVKTGLLMIWCNEPELYKEQTYREYLKELKFSTKMNPLTLYIASNTEILQWCSLIESIEKIRNSQLVEEFKFFYPSDYYSGGKIAPLRIDHINIVHLFSTYIFAKSKEKLLVNEITLPHEVSHVFLFIEPTLNELNFMYSCIQPFQLEDANELRIHLYNYNPTLRSDVEQFVREKKEKLKWENSKLKLKIEYMIKLSDVPEEYNE